jgi:CTP:molybdopterin cytidylyltransferase MocA
MECNGPMDSTDPVAAVLLAAGAATRFGSRKAAVRVGTRTMVEAVADTAAAAGLRPVLVVAPASLSPPVTATPVVNDAPEQGLSRSLQLGIDAVPPECAAAVVLLGDQPTVSAATLRALLDARGATPIVAVRAEGRLGPPVLLERRAFEMVRDLDGDAGLRDALEGRPELVTAVDRERHAPDVDVPADLERITERCAGCGARYLPVEHGETHPYIGASPACWAAFGEVLAREFQDRAYGRVHRHTVDVYAAQHPGENDRRQRQSVAIHLIGLCHWLEHGLDAPGIIAATEAMLKAGRRDWPWLEPPTAYEMTVGDVLGARNGEEHERLVRRWAETTWKAWSPHHETVRRWAREALP